MQEQFVTYEISLKLKELGFDEECLAYYTKDKELILLSAKERGELVGHGSVKNFLFKYLKDNDKTHGELFTLSNSITAPLWQQCLDWFREKHNLDVYTEPTYSLTEYSFKIISVQGKSKRQEYWGDMAKTYKSYQEAREQAILKAIELIK